MRRLSDERGAILLLTLGAMVALLLIGAASSLFTRSDQRLTQNLRDSTRALFLADAGIEEAHNRLRGDDPGLYFEGDETAEEEATALGGGTYTVNVGARDGSGRRIVSATGTYAGISRGVTATLRRVGLDSSGPSDCVLPGDADSDGLCDGRIGLFGNRDLSLSSGSFVDSYGAEVAAYYAATAKAHGHAATNGDLVLLGSGTRIRGSAFVGRTLTSGTGNVIEGPRQPLPAMFLPPLPDHASACSGITNQLIVDCNSPYLPAPTAVIGVPPDQTLTVLGGQTLCMPAGEYCFAQVNVQSGGTLKIVDTAATDTSTFPTLLRLGNGTTAMRVNGRLEYGEGMRPNLLRVFARGDIEIDGWSGAQVYGLFYAPRSKIRLNIGSSGFAMDAYGAAFGDRVILGGGLVRFHVDESATFGAFCSNGSDPTCQPAFVLRDDWGEDRS